MARARVMWIVIHDAAVGADGHIDARLLIVFVTRRGDFDERGRLAAADALGLAGDADGAAADADLHEVCARTQPGKRKPSRSTTLPAPTLTVSP